MTDFNLLEEFPAKATELTDLSVKRWLDKFRASYNQLQNLLLPDSSDTGYVIRNSVGQIAYRSIEGTESEINVTNNDGVSGNTIINLSSPLTFPAINSQIGVSNVYQTIGGNLYINSTSTANQGAGETTLMSYTFPGGFFNSDGIIIEFYAAGSYTSNSDNKTIQLYLNGASQYTSGAVAVNTSGNAWSINGQIIRRSSTNVYLHGRALYSFATPVDTAFLIDIGCNFDNDIVFNFTGTGGVDNDITQDVFILKYYPAAS